MATGLQDDLLRIDAKTQQGLIDHRRHLHSEPELAFAEHQTAAYIARTLDGMGSVDNVHFVAGTGVVADIKGKLPGRSLLVRADMDALPITEAGDLPFRSRHQGVMHACGHDVHMAIALQLASYLSANADRLPGTVRFAFQPAEEGAGGARAMVEAGVLDGVDRVVGLHVWAGLPTGQVSVRGDAMMASADFFTLTVRGKGGHGAMPEATVDAIVIAVEIVGALQTLVSRETSPRAPVVVTLGSIHGGSAHNIIAGQVVILGTLRTFDAELRARLLNRIRELAAGIAEAMRGSCGFRHDSGTPPTVNDSAVARLVAGAARTVLGEAAVVPFEPLMVGEDFAYFLEARPGCFFLLGGAPEGPPVVHHTAEFSVDERCLAIGLRVMTAAVLRLLAPD
ncbi:MAG: M20 family metallopeptidase [Candidatus Dormibacteraeota bacterium]|nr:M20 family metallopeptidase [Candidatus Dormibacteraeota bacterium]